MNVEELEHIRDVHEMLEEFNIDFGKLVDIYEEQDLSTLTVAEKLLLNNIVALYKQYKCVEKSLTGFKDKVDKKYWSEWVKKYPHCHPDYDTHNNWTKDL